MPIRMPLVIAVLGALIAAPASGDSRGDVVAAEKAFDAYTHQHGYTKGFLTFSAPDAVAFHPQAIRIHDALAAKLKASPAESDAPSQLRWAPYRVEVSGANDLAFDLGTWTEGTSSGWFFTIWKKQPNGKWLWELDTPAGTADPSAPVVPLAATPPPAVSPHGAKPDDKAVDSKALGAVIELDQVLNRTLAMTSPAEALSPGRYGVLDANAVVLASDRPPASTPDAITATLNTRPSQATWAPDGGSVSASGDFAYSWGHVTAADGTYLGHYARIWVRRNADWRLLVDLYGASGT